MCVTYGALVPGVASLAFFVLSISCKDHARMSVSLSLLSLYVSMFVFYSVCPCVSTCFFMPVYICLFVSLCVCLCKILIFKTSLLFCECVYVHFRVRVWVRVCHGMRVEEAQGQLCGVSSPSIFVCILGIKLRQSNCCSEYFTFHAILLSPTWMF